MTARHPAQRDDNKARREHPYSRGPREELSFRAQLHRARNLLFHPPHNGPICTVEERRFSAALSARKRKRRRVEGSQPFVRVEGSYQGTPLGVPLSTHKKSRGFSRWGRARTGQ